MTNEGTPSYKYVDDKVGKVEARLDKLIQVHESDLTAQKEVILLTQQYLAILAMDITQLHMRNAIDAKSSKINKERIREYIISEYVKAKEGVLNSPEPLRISAEFKRTCVKCSEKYELNAFSE